MKIRSVLLKASAIIVLLFLAISPASAASSQQSWNQAKVMWKTTPNAAYYNIYYKDSHAKEWQHSVPGLPSTTTAYVVKYLRKTVSYKYNVSAVDNNGKEFWWSGEKWMIISSMNPSR